MRDLIGRTLGRYRIVEKIGAGGMGVVYRAHDERLDRDVAVKVLPEEVAGDPIRLRRFEREAKAVAALSHPSILEIFDFDTEHGITFAVTELLEGETLREHLVNVDDPLPSKQVCVIGVSVASGLEAAHSKGVIHRDIKPSNIFLCHDGRVKILDFGLAAKHEKVDSEAKTESFQVPLTRERAVLGTAAYMSPEQARGEEVDHRTDIWSLGAVLYEMVTGQLPFRGDHPQSVIGRILNDEPEPVGELAKGTPTDLEKIINRALAKDRDARYGSASDMRAELAEFRASISSPVSRRIDVKAVLSRPRILIPIAVLVVALGILLVWSSIRWRKVEWARNEALPEVMRLAESGEFKEAFELACDAERFLGNDAVLEGLWPKMSWTVSINSSPVGASVSVKEFAKPASQWTVLGETPIEDSRLPFGLFRCKLEKEGYETVERLLLSKDEVITLPQSGSMPPEMVRIPSGSTDYRYFMVSGVELESIELPDFLIDRFEVSNRQFKEFVDGTGYEEREFWRYEFIDDGGPLTWQQAMEIFRDSTGRPGPATWEGGSYPPGQEDHPVRGVSWYEAAAYANFAGKMLPSVYHWVRAAGPRFAAFSLPLSNLEGEDVVAAGEFEGMSPFGAYDMAGNVREWCFNEVEGKRIVAGGAWNSPKYEFSYSASDSPIDRPDTTGFRCMKVMTSDVAAEKAFEPLKPRQVRDYSAELPVPDEIFGIYRGMYSYDKTEPNAVVESSSTTPENWTWETISFDAAYGNERITAHLFLPNAVQQPYQAVVFFPGSDAVTTRSSDQLSKQLGYIDFVIKSGRALLYPVYKGTYERGDGTAYPTTSMSLWRDLSIMWFKDVARSVDYLETRNDIDITRLAYFGVSLGAHTGVKHLALEPRFKAGVLASGGLLLAPEFKLAPEADHINFAPRVKVPTLMMNGRYDQWFPLQTSQVPLFKMLGTPPEHKRHAVFDVAHRVPQKERIKETLDWLDRYLGKVE